MRLRARALVQRCARAFWCAEKRSSVDVCLASHGLLELARPEVAGGVAERAAGRDGREVGLGQVDVRGEVLHTHARSTRARAHTHTRKHTIRTHARTHALNKLSRSWARSGRASVGRVVKPRRRESVGQGRVVVVVMGGDGGWLW